MVLLQFSESLKQVFVPLTAAFYGCIDLSLRYKLLGVFFLSSKVPRYIYAIIKNDSHVEPTQSFLNLSSQPEYFSFLNYSKPYS